MKKGKVKEREQLVASVAVGCTPLKAVSVIGKDPWGAGYFGTIRPRLAGRVQVSTQEGSAEWLSFSVSGLILGGYKVGYRDTTELCRLVR